MMAVSIMLYHLHEGDAATILGKLGIYGVSIFFILSGLSMAIAYDRYIKDLRSSGFFFIRRLFRIWPLLWLAIACIVLPAYFRGRSFGVVTIALNLTTLFGFVARTRYINTGAWSIGNEMVYYALTPLLVIIYHYRRWLGNLMTLVATAIGVLFAFHLLNPEMSLVSQWPTYINPFNNLFLYCSGLTIYYNFRNLTVPSFWYFALMIGSAAAFIFYPSTGDQINLVTGGHRVAFSLISAAIVLAFYKCPQFLPDAIGDRFEQLGIATYGVYLLHPIVMYWTSKSLRTLGIYEGHVFVLLVIAITISLALIIFTVYESPLIRLGKRITPSRTARVASS
jgi:peptidoglycan/LPS O-acetylase OafA/YrhL